MMLPEPGFQKARLTVDGAAFDTLDGAAAEFTRALRFTTPWEGSLDALNDLLYGGFGTPRDGFVLVWRNAGLSRECLGVAATLAWLDARIAHGRPYDVALLTARREALLRGEGQTLFDTIVEIIGEHPEIDLRLL